METDLNKIRKLSIEKEDENWRFRAFLKRCHIPPEEIDSIVHRLYRKISSQIDCKTCANCCKEIQPVLDRKDIERFSKCLGIPVAQFKSQYLIKDNDSEDYLFNKKPCPFLKVSLCSYYASRPEACVSYPYLHKTDFTSRLINVIGNYSICPIVFNVYEYLKDEIRRYDNPDEFDGFD